ncbi:MAG: coenzyme F420-0:L-glutamate ligase [Clostridia bacterium]|nr:coenzyme F420-0:L-glutamate ligase [Clostridia bacterium]
MENEITKPEALGVNEGKKLTVTVDGISYDRYAVKTRFVNIGDDYLSFMEECVAPYVKDGDFLSISEKIIAMCQKRIVYRKDIHPGFWAKLLCKFVHVTPAGPGAGTPHKMQLIIDICGLPRVLFATFCSAVTKLFGKKGVFYKVCGHQVDGIDGLIDYDISFPEYVDYAILNPENPSGVCNEIREKLGVECMIVDACDISVEVLGKSDGLTLTDETLCDIVRDNPAGQDGSRTPVVIVRKNNN